MTSVAVHLLSLAIASGLFSCAPAMRPLSLHPENPHYLLFRDRPTVLITSGEHYGAVLNLDFDYVTYLDELQRHDLNLTRTFSGSYCEGWGEGWNTLNPAQGRYLSPWARSDVPGYADGGAKFDLDRWDEAYFARLNDFVAQAGQRGIVVELVLFCVFYGDEQWSLCPLNARNNVNGIGAGGREHVFDESDPAMMAVQERLVRRLVESLRDHDNLYFELCNEPYFDGPGLGSPWNDRILRIVRQASDRHLIALNVANGSQPVERVPDGVSVLNFHYCAPPDAVAVNQRHPAVVAYDESGFAGSGGEVYRRHAWDFLLEGGAVFSNLDYSFTVESPQGRSTAADDKLGSTDPELRPHLQQLRRFLERFDLVRLRPDNAVIRGSLPDNATARILAEPGRQYAVYINGGTRADLQLELPRGRYSAEWVDPRTGRVTGQETLEHPGGVATLHSPVYDGDVALALRVLP
jgi:hypothetical protein